MKKISKKTLIIIFIIIGLISGILFASYQILHDETKLSVEEKEWITENLSTMHNLHIEKNIDVYSKNGSGVFYDFVEDFQQEYNLKVNLIPHESTEEITTSAFKTVYELEDNDLVFQEEHYVLISKEKENISRVSDITDKKIGALSVDEKIISKYFENMNNSIISYETQSDLYNALNENNDIQYVIVPLEENLTSILSNNYEIIYHIGDLKKYIVYNIKDEEIINNIIKKYYAEWSEKNLKESINKNKLALFIDALQISDKDINKIQSQTYNYGFINNNPYEILISGSYGGIVSEYINSFSEFSNTEFTFTKYKTFAKFTEAIANNKIDIFYNYYNLDTKYTKIDSLSNISFVVVANQQNKIVINSISSLSGKTVYVLKNSILEKYLTSIGGINIKTYANEKDLKKIAKKDNIIVIDKESFNYYNKTLLTNYNVRYTNILSETYNFYSKNNETFILLFNKYIKTLDPEEYKIKGLYNHNLTMKSGTLLGKVAKYSLIIIALILIIIFFAYRSTKKIKIAKKIKKEDKMKYIDQLTSLKNRNYLNENIANWNKNTIYPQATIIIDLNQVQTINDTMGYEQGDAQIKAAANVLIKTQLDNTDIMRTDGNEYLIYLVGYQEKQVVSYIRKLYTEFKNLPYEHVAAIGYSMITNDIKTIEDAINESVEDMRNKKEELEEG